MIEFKTLPKGWTIAKLREIGLCITGNTPPKSNPLNYGNEIPFIKPPQINNNIIDDASEYLSKEGGKKARILPTNSILVTCIGNLGRVGINKAPIAFNQQINAIIPFKIYEPELLFYQAQSLEFKTQLKSFSAATTVSIVNKGNFEKIIVPLAPLLEQTRILAKLEQLLTDLDKGIEYLKVAQQQLKVYRQAVLKWAFEGKLTNEDTKDGELPEGWKSKTIDDVADISTGVTPLRTNKSYWEKGTIPWITSGALNNEFVTKADEFVTKKAFEETTLKLLPKHTLLLALYGEGKTRGKCSELMFESTTNQAIAGIKLKEEFEQSRRFLKWFLLKNYQDIRLLSAGGVQPNLNSTIVKKTQFPFPPTEEQNKIIKEIESRLSICDKIEETIACSLQQAEALRLSIIKKAFEGKLVPQDPNDEPAEKLLERIKLEKLKKEQLKKGKNKSVGKIKRIS